MTDKKFVFDSTVPNDIINIYKDPEVSVRKLKPENENEFRIEIEGKSIDNSVVNALRRTVMMSIPIYAFHRSNVFIEVEKSRHMYNNDLLYNQIETLPIYDIPNYFDLENPEIFLPTEVMKNLFGKFIQEKYMDEKIDVEKTDIDKKLFKIEMSINTKNNTGSDKFVTTHDVVLKVDNKIANSYKIRKPIAIMVLKPTEEISMRAEANLGIAKMYASYEATTNAIHEEITPMKFNLWYETLEQLDKNIIFTKACIVLTKKLEYLRKFIKDKYNEERDLSETIEIQLYGEDHTMGNLLATVLQKCEFVEKAGYLMPHPFIDKIIISYQLNPKSKIGPFQVLVDCIDYLVKLFQMIAHVTLKKNNTVV